MLIIKDKTPLDWHHAAQRLAKSRCEALGHETLIGKPPCSECLVRMQDLLEKLAKLDRNFGLD